MTRRERAPVFRVGIGYDVHPFRDEGVEQGLKLGGVAIPCSRGLRGHSDADVLLHAVCDAMLGALGLGDLGRHFPDSDPHLKGISSLVLLDKVLDLMRREGYRLINLDAVIIAQAPRLAEHLEAIRARIAGAVDDAGSQVNVKVKSPEGI
ncbi:MAG: 2-C-methyl-D-erythritol 2,4-cyclodiphosphate synthase, partial [Acidobacteriota bacterium]